MCILNHSISMIFLHNIGNLNVCYYLKEEIYFKLAEFLITNAFYC